MNHILYIRKRYFRQREDGNNDNPYEAVYDCMNSEGTKDPYPIIRTDDENNKNIYKVIINVEPLLWEDHRAPRLRIAKQPNQRDQTELRNAQTQTKDGKIKLKDIDDRFYIEYASTNNLEQLEGLHITNEGRSNSSKHEGNNFNKSNREDKTENS